MGWDSLKLFLSPQIKDRDDVVLPSDCKLEAIGCKIRTKNRVILLNFINSFSCSQIPDHG